LARNWHASWWEWHVLILLAFAVVTVAAQRSWHEERYGAFYLDDTTSGTREISVLFADLQGFTTLSEAHGPDAVTEMLNEYFTVGIPVVVAKGGDVDRIIGDALMVAFNKRGDQQDHALRAARAGLELQTATGVVAARNPRWPRFPVGVNTGPVAAALLRARGGRRDALL